jgi:hypothetical protein
MHQHQQKNRALGLNVSYTDQAAAAQAALRAFSPPTAATIAMAKIA